MLLGSEQAVFYLYRLLARFAEVLPAAAIPPLAKAVGAIAPNLFKKRSSLVRSHLERAMGRRPTSKELNESFASYARYWLESLRLPVVPKDLLVKTVRVKGLEHADTARGIGRGIILAVPHVGNWDVAGAWFAQSGMALTVVVEKINPPKLRQWFFDFRTSLGVRVIVNDTGVGSVLLAALRRNEVVVLLCDRDVDGTGLPVEFFGETTKVPKGPATLAFRSGATLLPAAVYETSDGHEIYLDPPIEMNREGRLRDDVTATTQELTKCIEGLIRRAPTQWHLFQPNWPSDSAQSTDTA